MTLEAKMVSFFRPGYFAIAAILTPCIAFGLYVASLVVPIVIKEVVPVVTRSVTGT
jgi:hypothetical protein